MNEGEGWKEGYKSCVCIYVREGERKRQTMDGCHINSGNRCIVPNTESESQTIDSEQRTNAHYMNIITVPTLFHSSVLQSVRLIW